MISMLSMVKKNKVKLGLLTDTDFLLMVEKRSRNGICQHYSSKWKS